MDSMDLDVLKTAVAWSQAGFATFLGTVVHTWGSAPRPVGSMLVLRGDGHIRGSVSGGCIEDDLIARVRDGAVSAAAPGLLTYGIGADEAHRFGLPCGGTLQLLMEPVGERSRLPELLDAVERKGVVRRTLDLRSGAVTLDALAASAAKVPLVCDDDRLVSVHGPRHRLLIIGAAQLSHYLASFALSLDYRVTVCDPRSEYMDEWPIAGVELSREMPDDIVLRMQLDAHSAVAALTHDPKLDDMALLEALKSPAFYVGAIGSRRNNERRRERLALFDLKPEEIARLHGPIGLYLGARTPPEIALCVLAEMTALRNGVPILQTHAARADAQESQQAQSTLSPNRADGPVRPQAVSVKQDAPAVFAGAAPATTSCAM